MAASYTIAATLAAPAMVLKVRAITKPKWWVLSGSLVEVDTLELSAFL